MIISLVADFLEQEADHTTQVKLIQNIWVFVIEGLKSSISHETCLLMSHFLEGREPLEVSGRILISVGIL